MDSSDPMISFDEDGTCNYCHEFSNVTKKRWFPNSRGQEKLKSMIDRLKTLGKGKEYDAILGLSGGIDSSYLALKSKEWGLRLLVVHVDGGWNSEAAVSNIEKLVDYCGYELFTEVINWSEMRDLQLAYLKAGVSNQDVPQDHAYFATLYKFATKNRVPSILSGGNIATEGIAPNWMFDPLDLANLIAIHKAHGEVMLKTFPKVTFFQRYIWFPFYHRMQVLRPLNFLPYTKSEALNELKSAVGWSDYGRKHGESHFTKFFQNYYLPERYGYDKRRPHISSLIVSGQISRSEALKQLEEPLYLDDQLSKDLDYISSKLGLKCEDIKNLVKIPVSKHNAYSTQENLYRLMKKTQEFLEKILGKKISAYS